MPADDEQSSLRAAGRQRLYPRITNPNWLVLRSRREIFRHWLEQLRGRRLRVLDIGGHLQPYRELVPEPHQYWSVDLRPGMLVNAIADAAHLPFANNSFDLAICTQMLEYAPDPLAVTREVHRVLQKEGVLLLSAPSLFPRDSPHDAWRFFPAALSSLLDDFSGVTIVSEVGSLAGFLRTVAVFAHVAARYRPLRFLLSISFVPLLNVIGFTFNAISGKREGAFTVNYSARATK